MKTILAIESSCDDTSCAVVRDGKVLSNVTASQDVHRQYGGVVPEVASREHQINIVPVTDAAIKQAGISKSEIDAIAYTRGPGLLGSLLVGVSFAKSLALALEVPLIEVHHIQGHVMAHFIDEPFPEFPFLCLTVAGGHTQIMLITSPTEMKIIGRTLDDAAGEAFDKTGKMLGLPYPAGPYIDKLARTGSPVFKFPEPDIAGYDFSFSGLKTSILRFLENGKKQNSNFVEENLADICASVQDRIVSILVNKVERCAKEMKIKNIAVAGGVSANSGLRNALINLGEKRKWKIFIPKMEYCTDNAAMIALAGYYRYMDGKFGQQDATPLARWPIDEVL